MTIEQRPDTDDGRGPTTSLTSMTSMTPATSTTSTTPTTSMADLAYQRLKDSLIMLDIRPGDPINDVALAAELGVGRTPIREVRNTDLCTNRFSRRACSCLPGHRDCGTMWAQKLLCFFYCFATALGQVRSACLLRACRTRVSNCSELALAHHAALAPVGLPIFPPDVLPAVSCDDFASGRFTSWQSSCSSSCSCAAACSTICSSSPCSALYVLLQVPQCNTCDHSMLVTLHPEASVDGILIKFR